MADSTHDTGQMGDDGFHEIQLSGKQLVFLFMTGTLVAVAIFLCGVQVGRGVKTVGIDAASGEPMASAAVPPAASTPSQPASASGGPPAAEPPAPAPEPDDELSYAKRLQSDSPPAETLKQPPAGSTSAPAVSAPAASTPRSESAGAPSKSAAPSSTASVASSAARPPAASAAAPHTGAGRPGAWIVQLTATKDHSNAEGIAKRLAAKGYPAFVLDPPSGAPVIYRVQVGGYADRSEADQIARRLEKDEQFKTYVHSR